MFTNFLGGAFNALHPGGGNQVAPGTIPTNLGSSGKLNAKEKDEEIGPTRIGIGTKDSIGVVQSPRARKHLEGGFSNASALNNSKSLINENLDYSNRGFANQLSMQQQIMLTNQMNNQLIAQSVGQHNQRQMTPRMMMMLMQQQSQMLHPNGMGSVPLNPNVAQGMNPLAVPNTPMYPQKIDSLNTSAPTVMQMGINGAPGQYQLINPGLNMNGRMPVFQGIGSFNDLPGNLPGSQIPPKHLLPMRDIGPVEAVYFNMGRFAGRGGPIRFFLLGKQIKHTFDNIDMSNWVRVRQELINSGEVIEAHLPIVRHNGRTLFETNAILRYLAKKVGEYGGNHISDFIVDMSLDKLAYWRDDCMAAISLVGDDPDTDVAPMFEHYLTARVGFYEGFEAILNRFSPGIFFTEKPTVCDYALFSLVYDDLQLTSFIRQQREVTEGNNEDETVFDMLERCPRIRNLYDELKTLPLIEQWCQEMESLAKMDDQDPSDSQNQFTNSNDTANDYSDEIQKNEIFERKGGSKESISDMVNQVPRMQGDMIPNRQVMLPTASASSLNQSYQQMINTNKTILQQMNMPGHIRQAEGEAPPGKQNRGIM